MSRKLAMLALTGLMMVQLFVVPGPISTAKEMFLINLESSVFNVEPGDAFQVSFYVGKLDESIGKVWAKMEDMEGFTSSPDSFFPPCKGMLSIKLDKALEQRQYRLAFRFWVQDANEKAIGIQTFNVQVNINHPYLLEMYCSDKVFRECNPVSINPTNIAKISIENNSNSNIDKASFVIKHDPDFVEFASLSKNPNIKLEYTIMDGLIHVSVNGIMKNNQNICIVSLKWTGNRKIAQSAVTLEITNLSFDDMDVDSSLLPKPRKLKLHYLETQEKISFTIIHPIKATSPTMEEDLISGKAFKPVYTTSKDSIEIRGNADFKDYSDSFITVNGVVASYDKQKKTFSGICHLPFEGRNLVTVMSVNDIRLTESMVFAVIRDTTPPQLSLSGNQMQYIPGNGSYTAKATGYWTEITIYTEKEVLLTINDDKMQIQEDKSLEDEFHPRKWFATTKLSTRNRENIFKVACKDPVGNISRVTLKIIR